MAALDESQKRQLLDKLHGNAGVGLPIAGSNALSCYQQLYALYFSDQEYLKAATVAYSLYTALDRVLRPASGAFLGAELASTVSPFARAAGQVSPVLEQQRAALLMLISALTLSPEQRLLMPSADRGDTFIAEAEGETNLRAIRQWFKDAAVATRRDAVTLEEAKRLLADVELQCNHEDIAMDVSAN
mmetsp:Transcript_50685/g.94674  ORF Transcript_50685/g.94674 Transcript_50685/m.94674 type:complete len:187 (-) Transcript_50685:27-587(-)